MEKKWQELFPNNIKEVLKEFSFRKPGKTLDLSKPTAKSMGNFYSDICLYLEVHSGGLDKPQFIDYKATWPLAVIGIKIYLIHLFHHS